MLWNQVMAKAKGAVMIRKIFKDLERRLYLFGTSKALSFSIEEEVAPACYIVMYNSTFRLFWDIIIFVCIIYTASFVPYRCAFSKKEEGFGVFNGIEAVVDALYIADLFMNFFIAYLDKDRKVEVRITKIAQEYLTTWFIWDLLACIPFQYFTPQNDENTPYWERAHLPLIYRYFSLSRMLKLVRLAKYDRTVERMLENCKMN